MAKELNFKILTEVQHGRWTSKESSKESINQKPHAIFFDNITNCRSRKCKIVRLMSFRLLYEYEISLRLMNSFVLI